MTKHIRISFRRGGSDYVVEYGEWRVRGLTEGEQEEVKQLQGELMQYQDFSTAQDIQSEKRQELMAKKKRLEELEQVKTDGQLIWTIQPKADIDSVLLVLRPEQVPIYVENLPGLLFTKLLEPQLTLNLTSGISPDLKALIDKSGSGIVMPRDTDLKEVVRKTLNSLAGSQDWLTSIDLSETCPAEGHPDFDGRKGPWPLVTEPDTIYIHPTSWLGDAWAPIDVGLKAAFGDRVSWHTSKKASHWKVKQ